MTFEFAETSILGLYKITPLVFQDERGFFMEVYSKAAFQPVGIMGDLVQMNHSRSIRGVVRGLHFQKDPYAQAKLVRCSFGEVFDVAVDLRRNSSSFGKWVGLVLSESNKNLLYIPRGLAHGFQAISEIAEVQYCADNIYAPNHEAGLAWNDPQLSIKWPIEPPLLSKRDKAWPELSRLILD